MTRERKEVSRVAKNNEGEERRECKGRMGGNRMKTGEKREKSE